MIKFITKYFAQIIAIIALAQPWLIAIWRKVFRKGKIDIFPSGHLEVGYSQYGPTLGLNSTLRCMNQNLFVSSITIELVKQKDHSKHLFEWGLFRVLKLTHKGEEAEAELPYGFALASNQPKRYNILFIDVNTKDEI